MKYFFIALILLSSCNNYSPKIKTSLVDTSAVISKHDASDTEIKAKNIWFDKLNGSSWPLPDTIGNKPASFYLANPKVAKLAKAFYRGEFRLGDNDSTTKLLSYVTTNDNLLRPFYRWCLDFTITISDGALAEYPGVPALAYATKFPNEFFDYMAKDTSGQRYKRWTEIIAYSGLNNYDKTKPEIESEIFDSMFNNCSFCNGRYNSRIFTFAKDITNAMNGTRL